MSFTPYYVNIEAAVGIQGGTAVVLDVVRAYTTAAWAFALGAERIVLTDDVDEALKLKALLPGSFAMKDSKPIPGFELSNSPIELQAHDLGGRTIVQRTTHGTVGAVAARRAEYLYCASFLTAAATAEAITRSGATDAYFVITGEGGAAEEDRACAEYIAALTSAMYSPSPPAGRELLGGVDSGPFLQRVAVSNVAGILAQRVADGAWGVHPDDIEAAMDVNRFDFLMRAREEHIEGHGQALVLRAYNRSDD